jgi:hypothetical protein
LCRSARTAASATIGKWWRHWSLPELQQVVTGIQDEATVAGAILDR